MKQNSLLDQIRRVLSILLNLAVVRMEPIAIRMSWEAVGEQTLTFYTENSNLFSAAVCLLVAVCQLWALLSGRALPRWVKRLKFIAACSLTLTFLTVVFVLAPCYPDEGGVVFLLTESSMLYHHLLNPVLVFVSFVFLEREPRLPARNIPLALVPTAIYGSIALPAPWWTANNWNGLNFQPPPKTRTRRMAAMAGLKKIRWDEKKSGAVTGLIL